MIRFRPSAKLDKAATVILLSQDQIKKKELPSIPSQKLRENVLSIINKRVFLGDNGELFPLVHEQQMVLLAGLGKLTELNQTGLRIVARNAFISNYLKKADSIEIIPHQQGDEEIISIIDAYLIGSYSWKKYCTACAEEKTPSEKDLFVVSAQKKIFDEAIEICQGVNLARNLVNENADIVTSVYLEKTIRDLARGKKNISLEILNKKEMKSKGLNLHLAVNQGSPNEPKLIIVKYRGADPKSKFTALVGKGITFDTGGLNLKPTGHIETMRCDMSGAAAVIGTLKNVLSLKIKKNIIFAVGIAENVTGSKSYKPGDVFRGYSGKTVEIGNTDAEGRLVLADAIAYVVKNYKPARLVDIATLTGACVVALGYDYTGLMTNDEELSRMLVRTSNWTDDLVWRLPSYPELKESIKSSIADLKNTSVLKGAGGAITAGEFLRQFTENTPWAHLDIAGTAFVDGKVKQYYSHGATGAGVRLLTNFLKNI